MIESPILSEITTNPTITPATITTAVNDVATGSFATVDLLPNIGNDVGDQAFVQSTNRLYIWSGVGWYLIATVTNASPTAITGVSDTYALATDGTATTVTAVSTDPEGLALTWSYAVSSGSLGLDIALGIGGFPKGRVIEIYGPESSGKTTLALHAIAEAQKAGGVCGFIDAEHALDPIYARNLGVKIEDLLI